MLGGCAGRGRVASRVVRKSKRAVGLRVTGMGLKPAVSVITHLLASHRQVSTLRTGSGMRSGSSIPVAAKCRPQLNLPITARRRVRGCGQPSSD